MSVKAPSDPGLAAVYVAPKRSDGRQRLAGAGATERLRRRSVEQEPNNETAKANKLPVPGGVSAKFEKAGDVDHFAVACKKGVKYAAAATTYEINSPTEVLIRVLDAKGAEVARSNPTQQAARVEFTPAADGDYIIACEHLNYLSGPNEIYHLSVQPVTGGLRRRAGPRSLRSACRRRHGGAGDRDAAQRLRGAGRVEHRRRCGSAGKVDAAGRADDRVRSAAGEGRARSRSVSRFACRAKATVDGKDDRAIRHARRRGEGDSRRHAEPAAGVAQRLRRRGDREAGVRAEADGRPGEHREGEGRQDPRRGDARRRRRRRHRARAAVPCRRT